MTMRPQSTLMACAALLLTACSALAPERTATPTVTASNTATATASDTATETATATLTPSATPTPSETPSPTAAGTATPSFVWGRINVEMASCRFGPGGGYLLSTTLFEGDEVDILGHMELNENWYFVERTANRDRGCWVSQELIDVGGDRSQIFPIDDPHLVLPFTTQPYDALEDVRATRQGNLVTISWAPFQWLPGDDSLQDKYLVETWICLNGEYVFRAYSTNDTSITIQDEQICDETSRGRALGSDKHGYTGWVTVPWP